MNQIKQLLAIVIFGSLALLPTLVLSKEALHFQTNLAEVPATESSSESEETTGPKVKLDPQQYNTYVDPQGRFSFAFKNNYEVFENKGVTTLRAVKNKEVAFQIFENQKTFRFPAEAYDCQVQGSQELCWSNESPSSVLTDLKLFVGGGENHQMLTRAEALNWVLSLANPTTNLNAHAADCFLDVKEDTAYSGAICFAKEKKIVVGVEGAFLPDRSIHLAGLLQYLTLAFDIKDLQFDPDLLEDELFELMTPYHLSTPLIAKAYEAGWIQNVQGYPFWPNRQVYYWEAEQIIQNFQDWRNGKTLKNHAIENSFVLSTALFHKDPNRNFTLKERSVSANDVKGNHPVYFRENSLTQSIDVYAWEAGKIWEFLSTLQDFKPGEIAGMSLNYDPQRLEMDLYVTQVNGETKRYQLKVQENEFAAYKGTQSTLEDPNLLPNAGISYPKGLQPELKIWMDESDYQNLISNNGSDVRFPAHMELTYPNGLQESQAVLIKTRGNANLSYIKPGFTIESFSRFETGDFLNGQDEFKLRSAFDDEVFMSEPLFFEAYRALGYPAPESFASTLSINGQDFGFYHVTEAVKEDFFEDRKINAEDYFYARNISSPYTANLSDPTGNEETILAHYKSKGDEDRLLELIQAIKAKDPNLIYQIDTKNIFDYTALIYRINAYDSIQGNYYLYWDKDAQQWRIFPWDGDKAFQDMPGSFTESQLQAFATQKTGLNNQLIQYVFTHLDTQTRHAYFEDFTARWDANVQLVTWLDEYKKSASAFFLFENELWNGRFLQREKAVYNTLHALAELRRELVQ